MERRWLLPLLQILTIVSFGVAVCLAISRRAPPWTADMIGALVAAVAIEVGLIAFFVVTLRRMARR
jgi:uncharacterized BrkB/YihY/UPF0761 family membrane protein